ncbi:MAG TPA: hypothetical protein VFK02_04050 [Kofleriaceae bacterium]|nr:hypothetical protein [Kofleriaceae bacterium]
MKLSSLLVAALIAAGCYSPRFKDDIACASDGSCPAGTTCGADLRCHVPGGGGGDGGGGGSGSGELPDAPPGNELDAGIDAAPVQCTGDPDCANPTDLCLKPGTCDLTTHLCVFTAVDCSGLSDECSRGTCEAATGNCIKAPINAGVHCGAGKVCGAFGACGGFDSTCDTSGTQSRSCTENTCQNGVCAANTFNESQACDRSVSSCGTSTITNCSACNYTSDCDESAQQTCTCTDFNCQGDTCVPASSSCVQSCTRDTDGLSCGACVNFRTKECQNGLCVTTDC